MAQNLDDIPSSLRVLPMSKDDKAKMLKFLGPFIEGVQKAITKDNFSAQEENEKTGLLPKQSQAALDAATDAGKQLSFFYEKLRVGDSAGKILWGTISGTRDFGGKLGVFHYIVAVLDLRTNKPNYFTGYCAMKYWKIGKKYSTGEQDAEGRDIMQRVSTREDISNKMLVNRKRWSVAVEGFFLEDGGYRSSLELGDMKSDGTCRALTCRAPKCVAARERIARKRAAPDADPTEGGGASKNPRVRETATLPNGEQAGGAGGPGPKNALPPLSLPASFRVLPTSAEEKQKEIFKLEDEKMGMAAEILELKAAMKAKEAKLVSVVLECKEAAETLQQEATLQKEERARFGAFRTAVKESMAKLSQADKVLGPFGSAIVVNAGGATSSLSRVRYQDSARGLQTKGEGKKAKSQQSDNE